jgi:hypothetical protein
MRSTVAMHRLARRVALLFVDGLSLAFLTRTKVALGAAAVQHALAVKSRRVPAACHAFAGGRTDGRADAAPVRGA